jgi:hypothetical protein
MKVVRVVTVLSMLCLSSLLLAQQVVPTSLSFEAVPPNTGPLEDIAFTNTGTTQLTLTISISGPPFAIGENRCGNGVKPNSHCNVYLTYSPQTVGEVDNGTLNINYGEGVVSVPLSGQGVAAIPTYVKMAFAPHQCDIIHVGHSFSMTAKVFVLDKYYALPTGEQVSASCTNGSDNINLGSATLQRCNRKHCGEGPFDEAPFGVNPDQTGTWSCTVTYDGDGILAWGDGSIEFQVVEKHSHCQ